MCIRAVHFVGKSIGQFLKVLNFCKKKTANKLIKVANYNPNAKKRTKFFVTYGKVKKKVFQKCLN